jgi:hypothetical protein
LIFNIVIFPDNWVLLVQTGLKYNEGNQELMDGARRYVSVHIYAFLNSSSISNVNNLEVGMCLNRNL